MFNLLLCICLFMKVLIKDVNADEDFYSLLGVDKSASKEEIKHAFKRMSLKYHPDKVPEDEKDAAMKKFAAISNAYEILMDDNKREIYDRGGEEALRRSEQGFSGGGDGGFDPFDFFNDFTNIFRTQQPHQSQAPRSDTVVPIELSLEELFTGKGAAPNGMKQCTKCNGHGMFTIRQSMPFGIIQTQQTCDMCGGTGRIIGEKCSVCKGGGTVMGSEALTITIPPGCPDGHEIVFAQLGDESANGQKGKLIIKIREKAMPVVNPVFRSSSESSDPLSHVNIKRFEKENDKPSFMRDGQNNLYTNITISLADSIIGAEFKIPHFLNKSVIINRQGMQTPEGTIVEVKEEGMPVFNKRGGPMSWFNSKGGNGKRASMFVKFHVEYPKNMNEMQMEYIKKALY